MFRRQIKLKPYVGHLRYTRGEAFAATTPRQEVRASRRAVVAVYGYGGTPKRKDDVESTHPSSFWDLARENRERCQRHICAGCTIRADDGRCWRSTERSVPHLGGSAGHRTSAGHAPPRPSRQLAGARDDETAPHMVYLMMYQDKPPHIRGMGTVSGVTPCATMNASTWSQKNWLTAGGAPQPS